MVTSLYEWKDSRVGWPPPPPQKKEVGKQDIEPWISQLFILLKNENDILKTLGFPFQ